MALVNHELRYMLFREKSTKRLSWTKYSTGLWRLRYSAKEEHGRLVEAKEIEKRLSVFDRPYIVEYQFPHMPRKR